MKTSLINLIGLAAATRYELVAIHCDDIFAYSVVHLSEDSHLALDGNPVQFEFSNGGIKTYNEQNDGVVDIQDGYLLADPSTQEQVPNYGWSLHDSIYLPGQYWVCEDETRTIATGASDPPRSCNNPISVLLYASPV